MTRTRTTTTLATAALALPLLVAGAQAAGATDAPKASQPSTATSAGAVQLKAVPDPCSSSCPIMRQVTVAHPTAGPLEIRVYGQDHHADHGKVSMRPAYAVYQDSRAVGFEQSGPDVRRGSFTDHPTAGHQVWDVPDGRAVDRHGNVYLSDNAGVTVPTPTATGYETRGTMPTTLRSVQDEFHSAGLRIDASGEPSVSYVELDERGVATDYLITETWSDNAFHLSLRERLHPRAG